MRAWAVAMVLATASPAMAQSLDPLLEIHDADPLRLANAVERLGDVAIVARFDAPYPLAVRMLAVQAARFLHAPELALPPLAELAAGTDPDLAPAAMRSLLAIARSLDRASLDAREHDPAFGHDELARTRATLTALAADETARLDLRRAAEAIVAMLAALEPA